LEDRQPTVNRYRHRVLSVQLLGDITVERDGVPVVLSGPQRRLLTFLALHPGPHDRDALAARFWPDTPTPRASLRTAVWALRQSLGTDALVATRASVALGNVTRDIDDPDRDGEPWPALDDDWAEAARVAHHEHRIARFDAQIAAADDPVVATALATRRCALTPLDEPAHRALIERLAAAGDRAGALLVGRELAARLRDELGVELAPATRALLASLRVPGPSGAVSAARARPFYGRSRELVALTDAWAAARDGRGGRVVLVTGEAGIGKTRLITELARRAQDGGAHVAVGAGVDIGGEAPLAVWQELARALVGLVPRPPETAGWPAELGRLAPDLARALGASAPAPVVTAPELERLRLFDAVLRLVEWAARRPVLLVAEDTHRADRASLALCAHIGRRIAGLPVLFVLTRRDRPTKPEADALLVDLASRGLDVTEIELSPLQPREVVEVARSVAALPDAVLDQVVTVADGNPLLAVESARALAAGHTAPPASLRALVRAALGAIPRPARHLAEAVAAAGRALSAAEIAALPAAAEAERHVLDTGLIGRNRGGLGYRHALLAEAARADLDDPHSTHLAVALAVEAATPPAVAGDRAAEVARHLQRAGRDDLAANRWQRAARHARSLGALPEAAAFWGEVTRADPEDAQAWLELAETYAWLGRTADFEDSWAAALARLAPADQPAAWCRRGLWFKTVACNPPASLAAYRQAHELLPPGAPIALRLRVQLGLVWNEASAGDAVRAEALLAETVVLIAEADVPIDAEVDVELEIARLIVAMRLGRFTECEAAGTRAGAAADRFRRPDLGYVVWTMTACALTCAGDLIGALRCADRGVTATRGIPVAALPCLAARAHLLSRIGRHDEAATTAAELTATAERLDSPAMLAVARYDAGLVALAAGRPRDAADLIGRALAEDAAVSRPAARLALAEALAVAGDPDGGAAQVRAAALEPVAQADQPWALVPRMARVQGIVARANGDLDRARRHFVEAAETWRRLGGRNQNAGDEYMAALVDLGRPPVVGLVDPGRELRRTLAELADLEAACPGSR
jgi:DNA-binding SARP family transcriptional activator/tetratricopeptide (TPR) repeat protein